MWVRDVNKEIENEKMTRWHITAQVPLCLQCAKRSWETATLNHNRPATCLKLKLYHRGNVLSTSRCWTSLSQVMRVEAVSHPHQPLLYRYPCLQVAILSHQGSLLKDHLCQKGIVVMVKDLNQLFLQVAATLAKHPSLHNLSHLLQNQSTTV